MKCRVLFASFCLLFATTAAFADDKKSEEEKDREQFPKFEEQVKDWKEEEGFLRIYRKEKEERMLAAIPKALLDEPFFLATSVSGGSDYAGWQWQDTLLRFERFNKKILLVELNTRQRAEKGKPLASVVRRTYADRLLATLDIKAIGPKNEILVDLGGLLTRQFSTFFGSYFSLRSSLARFQKTKAFPDNVEVSIQMPLYGDGTFMTLHYSISRLPPLKTYSPRPADDRIGYFLTAIRDYTGGDPREGRMVRYINRWKLEKADPDLPMSPPREPIVFYIEKTVPIEYRRAVREGILEWNRAFEQVGITGAIDVRQQTETQFADLDPEDVRYNFFRWITSESAFAMGPSRVDPRNGRILDADIILDDSMLRGYIRDYDILIREGPSKMLTGPMRRWLEQHPEAHPLARFRPETPQQQRTRRAIRQAIDGDDTVRNALADALAPTVEGDERPISRAADLRRLPERVRNHKLCTIGEYLPHQVGLMDLALAGGLAKDAGPGAPTTAGNDEANREFMRQIVKETVMHEVGHTLGLRHNFKASSLYDLDTINSPERPAITTASVMDYHPVNMTDRLDGKGRPQGNFQTATIGPYDMLTIEYGYMLVEQGSQDLVKAVARKVAEQGLPYATDEDMNAPDPLIAAWDLGDDPIKFADYRLGLVKSLWKDLEKRSVKDDESYSRLRNALNITLWELQQSALFVSRSVGGLDFHRDHRGDPKARSPISVVEAERQRAAVSWVAKNVFAEDAIDVPADVIDKLAAGRWVHWGSSDGRARLEYSLLDRILQIQTWSLFFVTSDDVLARVWENEQRVLKGKPPAGKGPLTLPELFDTLEAAIFSELEAGVNRESSAAQPYVSSRRQNLQDAYVGRLVQIALGNGISPPVAQKLAWSRLQALETRFGGVLNNNRLDPYTRAHLQALSAKSQAARTAEYVHVASGGCALTPETPSRPSWPLGLLAMGMAGLFWIRRKALAAKSLTVSRAIC